MQNLTIFTPTYNRIELLARCYRSLQMQTNKNFIWLIIDDGSSDNTANTVNKWIADESDFIIKYIYKENGGLASAYNEAIANINTELSVCIDSDDFMPADAVEKILSFWSIHGSNKYAGIVGLDFNLDNTIIGDPLPNTKSINLIDLLVGKYKINNGDRTNVVRTSLYKEVAPMQLFDGEKNFNPHYMHLQISQNYNFLVLNENLRYVEYQPQGMTASIFNQYKNSPNSFLETRRLYLSFKNVPIIFKLKNAIHYVSSSILSGKFLKYMIQSPCKVLTTLAVIPGLFLTAYINYKTRK